MKTMLTITLLLTFLFQYPVLAQSNGGGQYEFPVQSVAAGRIGNCAEDPTDILIDLAGGLDKALLSGYEVTTGEEEAFGAEIHEQMRANFEFIEDGRTTKLRRMLRKMLPHVERRDLNYQIFLVEADIVNAWTIPGGHIYVTTGMLNFSENDHELANVIGHEIGHNENRHTARFIQREKQKQEITSITGGFDLSVLVDLYSMATVAYNQPQEIESDYTGFYLAHQIGYDPEIGLEFWRRMAQSEHPNQLEKLFRSHPYSATRYRCGKEYLEQSRRR